jgi:D-sedoheptulose 7-phosphate isomerase
LIKLIVLDIDGVITDGAVIVDMQGNEQKKINLKDVDAIFELHRQGYKLAAITGENTSIVEYFKKRFPWDHFYQDNKQKRITMEKIAGEEKLSLKEICYVGDGKYDVEPLEAAGLGLCPADAIDRAKAAADIILQNPGGQGCLWELVRILKEYNDDTLPQHYFYSRLADHENVFKVMASDQKLMGDVMQIAEDIACAMQNDGQLFLCGNGGSAADAQHIAAEFVSRFLKDRKGMPAEALSTNTSVLTAIGNDYSYESVFARQIEAKGRPGDIVMGISTSGKSKNVLEALRYAHKKGMKTVMLMGNYTNLELSDICDYVIKVPSKMTPRIQEAHIFIGHTMAEYVEYRVFGGNDTSGTK